MKTDVVGTAVKQYEHGLLGGPDGFVMIDHFHALGFIMGLKDKEFGSAIVYGKVLFHVRLLLCEFRYISKRRATMSDSV